MHMIGTHVICHLSIVEYIYIYIYIYMEKVNECFNRLYTIYFK